MISTEIISLYDLFRVAFTVADVLLFALFVFLIVKSWKFRPHLELTSESEKVYTLGNVVLQERWESIIGRSKINSPESVKLAVIDADNMVDDLLKRMGLAGEHMADRLENLSPNDFTSLGKLWDSHRVRNRLVHEPGFSVSQEEAARVLGGYASFLREIGVI